MKIYNVKTFLNSLEKAFSFTGQKSSCEIIQGVCFTPECFISTNLEHWSRVKIEGTYEKSSDDSFVLLEVPIMIKLLKNMTKKKNITDYCNTFYSSFFELEYIQKEERVVLKYGNKQFDFPTLPEEDFPEIPKIDEFENKIKLDSDFILEQFPRVLICASNEDHRYYLQGMNFNFEDRHVNFVASDGKRLHIYKHDIRTPVMKPQSVTIHSSFLNLFTKIIKSHKENKTVEIGTSKKYTMFHIDDDNYIVSNLKGTFLDYNQVIPSELNHFHNFTNDTFDDIVEEANNFLDRKNPRVDFNVDGVVESAMPKTCNFRIQTDIKPELPFSLNGYFLKDVRKVFKDEITMEWFNPSKAFVFESNYCDNLRCILMPMKNPKYEDIKEEEIVKEIEG